MLLKELKILEVDDSITDNIGGLFNSIKSAFKIGSLNATPKDVPKKFVKLFSDHIFVYRYNNLPAYDATAILKELKEEDIPELAETLKGVRLVFEQAARKFLRGFSSDSTTRIFSRQDIVSDTSNFEPTPADWKAYQAGSKNTTSFLRNMNEVNAEFLKTHFKNHKQLIALEFSSGSSVDSFIKLQVKIIEKLIDEDKIKEAIQSLERHLAMFYIFEANCLNLFEAISKSAETKKDVT